MNNKNISFESEHIIVDENNTPINYVDNIQTSEIIMNLLIKKYWEKAVLWKIWKELDSSQIEIRNSWAMDSLQNAQDELLSLYDMVYDIVYNEMWLKFLDWAVPNQNYEPVYTSWVEKYKVIDEKLRSIWLDYRKATNVVGVHFHIDTDVEFKSHMKISSSLSEIYKNDKSELLLWEERHKMVKRVVWGLKKLNFLDDRNSVSNLEPIDFYWLGIKDNIKDILLNPDWTPRFSYNYVWLKNPWKSLTTEVRSIDWVWSRESLIKSTNDIFNLVDYILKQK